MYPPRNPAASVSGKVVGRGKVCFILLELLKLLLYMKNLASPRQDWLSQQSDALVM